MLAVTVTLRVVFVARLPSLACKVKVALVAVQVALMFAVIVPLVLTIFCILTPLDGLVVTTVTVTPLPLLSASLTVAMVVLGADEPCWMVRPVCALMPGAVFGVQPPSQ